MFCGQTRIRWEETHKNLEWSNKKRHVRLWSDIEHHFFFFNRQQKIWGKRVTGENKAINLTDWITIFKSIIPSHTMQHYKEQTNKGKDLSTLCLAKECVKALPEWSLCMNSTWIIEANILISLKWIWNLYWETKEISFVEFLSTINLSWKWGTKIWGPYRIARTPTSLDSKILTRLESIAESTPSLLWRTPHIPAGLTFPLSLCQQ